MFATLKSTPKLLGAKVKIKFLYYDQYDDDNETVSYEQAVIYKISIKPEIEALDFTLSHCVVGIKRVPGIHHYDHVLRIEHLRVIKEGHSDVKWEPTPAPRHRLSSKLKQDPPPDLSPSPPKEQRFSQRFASVRPKVVLPSPLTRLRPCKPTTIHKFTKAFVSEKLNIFPFFYRRHD